MRLLGLLLLGGVIAGAWAAATTKQGPDSTTTVAMPAAPAKPREPDPWENFKISKYQMQKAGFGVVGVADFTFRNDNAYAVKDALVACSFYGASGTKLGERQVTVYEAFPAQKSRTVKGVNVGFINDQARSSECRIVLVSRAT